jgi:hypothetical protein
LQLPLPALLLNAYLSLFSVSLAALSDSVEFVASRRSMVIFLPR